MDSKTIALAFDVASEIARIVMDALQDNDPATLQKVTDILPREHTLKSRIAFEQARISAQSRLGNGQ